jgi:poly-gamma-glutamate synthesis protein (capsule biosynthesis protein)
MKKIKVVLIILVFISFVFVFCSVLLCYSENEKILKSKLEGEKEFSDFLLQKENFRQISEEVSLIAVGDISFSRGVERVVKKQKDINYPFLRIWDYLRTADIVFGNLETPITPGAEIPPHCMIFRSNPGTEKVLKEAGFSIVSLANNHTPNFGERGLKDTFNYLNSVGIKYIGAGLNEEEAYKPVYIEKKGIIFAFLGYTDPSIVPKEYEASDEVAGTAFMRVDKMIKTIKEAKKIADFVIVSMHTGIEYTEKLSKLQLRFSHKAIDAGADLVIGHHPHVVQAIEKYKGKYIFYSLGNFVFDRMKSKDTQEGLIIKIYFKKDDISKISFLPVVMEKLAQPRMAHKDEAEKILRRLKFPIESRVSYFWNENKNDFEKVRTPVVYVSSNKVREIIYKQEIEDLDKDNIPENYELKNGRLIITEQGKVIWQSPTNWWIDNFFIADSNNDGVIDINLSLKPFWMKENDWSVKNHFFVLNLIQNKIKQIWCSSSLSKPNLEFKIADVDNDGKNDLIVIEGEYQQKSECNNCVAVWGWNGWGFSNNWRSEKGTFANLEIEKIDGKTYIVVDTFK